MDPDHIPADATRSESLAAARAAVRRIEAGGRPARTPLALGWSAPDAALGGGLAPDALHEVAGAGATGFVVRLLARLTGPVLWATAGRADPPPYAPGLLQAGLDPARLVRVRVRARADGLWVMEEALRSGALAAVVLESAHPLDLTAARRLQLAAETGGAPGLLLRPEGTDPSAAGATTQWHAAPVPAAIAGDGTVTRHWHLTLLRGRGVPPGAWTVPAP